VILLTARHSLSGVCLLTLLIFGICLSANLAMAQINSGGSKLQAANNAIGQAFNAINSAEEAGANVTDLVIELNGAAGLLASIENSENSDVVAAQVDSVISVSEDVRIVALEAKQTAIVSSKNTLWSNIILSILSGLVFISALFLMWRLLKKHLNQNFANAKKPVVRICS
jgi:hypothetical protein